MRQQVTTGIVLARTNYGEADRIITVLTPDQGKIRLLAKGVRKIKSRMAGGIELFSVNDITYIVGRGDLGTLISSRLKKNYGNIVKDVHRTMYAYEVLKSVHKATEDLAEDDYFSVLRESLMAINEPEVELDYIRLWFYMHLLQLSGHAPNLATNVQGSRLAEDKTYTFSFDDMSFAEHGAGPFVAKHVKILRLAQQASSPLKLANIQVTPEILSSVVQLSRTMAKQSIRA